eukprot:GFYU01002958.1.p1 GENE.GFYU01002958.1~~GFYU01002958.1.p1  ORF type:complete len:566 (+),score=131.49 GFYU01002958.1:476-2173(+)
MWGGRRSNSGSSSGGMFGFSSSAGASGSVSSESGGNTHQPPNATTPSPASPLSTPAAQQPPRTASDGDPASPAAAAAGGNTSEQAVPPSYSQTNAPPTQTMSKASPQMNAAQSMGAPTSVSSAQYSQEPTHPMYNTPKSSKVKFKAPEGHYTLSREGAVPQDRVSRQGGHNQYKSPKLSQVRVPNPKVHDAYRTFVIYNYKDILYCCDVQDISRPLVEHGMKGMKITTHAVNVDSASTEQMDVVIGSASGEIAILDVAQKSGGSLVNKDGVITPACCSKVCWVPGSRTLFLSAHLDGRIYMLDKEKSDQPMPPLSKDECFSVTRHTAKNQRFNPMSRWNVCNDQINDMAFSPNQMILAVAANDGYLRVFDFIAETQLCQFQSYYGAFLCVAWMPNSRQLVSGSQDDHITLWNIPDNKAASKGQPAATDEYRILARGVTHTSWITAIAVDPWHVNHTHNANTGAGGGGGGGGTGHKEHSRPKGGVYAPHRTARLQQFFVRGSEGVTQLSDHYGICSTLVFNARSDNLRDLISNGVASPRGPSSPFASPALTRTHSATTDDLNTLIL